MTPYQQLGFEGGYTNQYLGNDTFLITVRVNAYTDEATAYEYFHRRANEICQQSGYTPYEVLEMNTDAKQSMIFLNNKAHMVKKPCIYGRIKCYKN